MRCASRGAVVCACSPAARASTSSPTISRAPWTSGSASCPHATLRGRCRSSRRARRSSRCDGRIDVATARSERYDAPGALPRVLPAAIGLDLQRRDFAVNAMAVEVTTDAWELLDPFGGLVDLERRRLRILHPLSFVEDPTRILRGARYAARLELRPDPWTTRCQALALRLAPYAALSGQRIATDLERLLDEPTGPAALAMLARGGVPRLLDPRWRETRGTSAGLAAVPATLAWVRSQRVARPIVVAALALAADQPSTLAEAMTGRLGLS